MDESEVCYIGVLYYSEAEKFWTKTEYKKRLIMTLYLQRRLIRVNRWKGIPGFKRIPHVITVYKMFMPKNKLLDVRAIDV